MIQFPGDDQRGGGTRSGSYGASGGAERFGQIDASIINVTNLNASNITAGSIDGSRITANTVTATQIAADAITTSELAANSVSTSKIVANAVETDKIAANAVTATKISVSSLSAVSANLGNVVVGGSADALGTLVVKNSSSVEIAKLNQSGIIVRNTRALFFEQTSAGSYWDLSVNSSNQALTSLPSTNEFRMVDFAGTTDLFTVSTAKGSYARPVGGVLGNGQATNLNDSARVMKSGSSAVHINSDSYGDITINFGYTFSTSTSNPFVVATVSNTTGSLGGVHEWNCGVDSFSGSGCHAKVRNVYGASGTGDISVDWHALGFPS